MAKIELPPTKSSLRKIKEDLIFAYEGHDLLNQKREILAIEIVRKIGEIRKIESEFLDLLNELYAAYRNSAVDMGAQAITLKSCSEKKAYGLQLKFVKLMGLKLPRISLELAPFEPPDGLAGTQGAQGACRICDGYQRDRHALEGAEKSATAGKRAGEGVHSAP